MNNNKRIVVVSGMNGCGKSTFIQNMKELLISQSISVDVFKAPFYQSESGQLIQRYLSGQHVADIEAIFAINRSEVYWQIGLSTADVILVDRLDLDGHVFAQLRQNDVQYFGDRQDIYIQILLDVDESIAYQRLMNRPINNQIYYSVDNLKRARQIFLDAMSRQRWADIHLILDSSSPFSQRKLNAIAHMII